MSRPVHRLRRRLVFAFSGFTVVVAAVFALYAVVFMYTVEDSIFNARLQQEADRQMTGLAGNGDWHPPADARVHLFRDAAALPADLQAGLQHEPWRSEVAGTQGRHYHVRRLLHPQGAQSWLVSEVSDELVVRPIRDKVVLVLVGTGLLMVLLAIALGVWLAHRGTRGLHALVQQVEALPLQATPSPSLAAGQADDEIGVLARALDRLYARIGAFVERETTFTRDASHELRTPLTVIAMAAGRLLHEPGLSATGRAQVKQIRASSAQLQQAVTALLTLAREVGPAASTTHVRLRPLLEQLIIEQAPLLEDRQVDVTLDLADDATLHAAEPVLRIVLSNLIGNAFAHSLHGTVTIDQRGPVLVIENPAMGSTDLHSWPTPHAFEKRSDSRGSGLGLSIMRRLCDQQGMSLQITVGHERVQACLTGVRTDLPPAAAH